MIASRTRLHRAAALLAVAVAPACTTQDEPVRLAGSIERALGTARPLEVRLSNLPRHAPCGAHRGLVCDGVRIRDPSALVELANRVRSLELYDDAEALILGATVDLVTSAAAGNGVGASVQLLRDALALEPGRAAAWSDLAAAYLVRGGSGADAVRAVDAAAKAVRLDPSLAAARFNLALALEHLQLRRTAARGWRGYRDTDDDTGWAREAERRARKLEPLPGGGRRGEPGGASADRAVREDRQYARLLAQDSVLPAWGAAVIAGDSAAAREALSVAGELGAALAEAGGDRSVIALVEEARTPGSSAHRTRLARAHVEFGRARSAYDAASYGAAREAFMAAAGAAPPDASVLAGWIRFYLAATAMYARELDAARAMLADLAARVDATAFPALAGRARWGLGSIALREGRYVEARERFREAASLFRGAGERENAGATRYLTAEAGMALGLSWTAADSVAAALDALNDGPPTVWLHNLLYSAAEHARALGLPDGALAFQNEGVAVARELAHPLYIAEALLARSRLRFREGYSDDAAADLAGADSVIPGIPDPRARQWIDMDRRHAAAVLSSATEPAVAAADLAEVADFFSGAGSVPRFAAAMLDRATALGAAGDGVGRRRVLGELLDLAESQVRAAPDVPLRASLAMTAHSALVGAIAHDLDAGDPAAALAVLASWSTARAGAPAPTPSSQRTPGSADEAFLALQLLADGVAAILRWGPRLEAVRIRIDPEDLARDVEALAAAGERGAAAEAMRARLAALYDGLVRPVLPGPRFPARLRIHAGDALAAVPFAALYDTREDRYLVEKTAIVHAATAAEASPPHDPVATSRVLAIAADAFGPEADLPPLPRAAGEARAVAASYPDGRLLYGAEADAAAIIGAARSADILHFAGHAVVDPERPWSSRLVVAADSGAGAGALEVPAFLDAFRHLDLVVLASCRSATRQGAVADGFTGVADALAAAGVGTTVGAVWVVSDADAAAVLIPFHERLAAGATPADALRDAQIGMIRSPEARHRSPAAWAAYRAVTR